MSVYDSLACFLPTRRRLRSTQIPDTVIDNIIDCLFYKVEMKAVLSLLKFKLGRCDLSCVGGGRRLQFHGVFSIHRLVQAPETLRQDRLALLPEPFADGHVDYKVGC